MKQIDPKLATQHAERKHDQDMLLAAMAGLTDPVQIQALLIDLCTPAELEAIVDRWRVVMALDEGMTYREIHANTGVSVTTVGRVARCHEMGEGGYAIALKCLKQLNLIKQHDDNRAS